MDNRRPIDPQLGAIQRLSHSEQRNLVVTEARRSLEESFDAYTALSDIDPAANFVLASDPVGRRIGISALGVINDYFRRQKVCMKNLTQTEGFEVLEGEGVSLDQVKARFRSAQQKLAEAKRIMRVPKMPVDDFMWAVGQAIERAEKNEDSTVFAIAEDIGRHPQFTTYLEKMREPLRFVSSRLPGSLSEDERLRIPEMVIATAAQSSVVIPGVVDIYKSKFNGFSLKDLVDAQNPQQFTSRALRYLRGIPKGDIFWQRIVGSILFTFGEKPNDFNIDVARVRDIKLLKNILGFQTTLAEKIAGPGVMGNVVDRQFDRQFVEILPYFDKSNVVKLAQVVAGTIIYGPHVEQLLQPGITFDEAIARSSLTRSMGEPLDRHAAVKVWAMDMRVKERFPRIASSVRGRFHEWINVEALAVSFEQMVQHANGWSKGTEKFIETITERLGEDTFNQKLNSAETIAQVREALGQSCREGNLLEGVEEHSGGFIATYDSGSLPRVMGASYFYLQRRDEGGHHFIVIDRSNEGYVAGTIDEDGAGHWDGQFPETHAYFADALGQIVNASFVEYLRMQAEGRITKPTEVKTETKKHERMSADVAHQSLQDYLRTV